MDPSSYKLEYGVSKPDFQKQTPMDQNTWQNDVHRNAMCLFQTTNGIIVNLIPNQFANLVT